MQTYEREIILDTETTGLDPVDGHRIIEVAAIEVIGTEETGRVFHREYDPEREIPEEATKVHGKTWDMLRGKPLFADGARELADFIDGATLVIHNAPFDMKFLNAEFGWADVRPSYGKVVDTIQTARRRFPGQGVSLDALCDRLGVDRTARDIHGALVDVKLLFQVYVRLLGRDQLIPMDVAVDKAVAAVVAAPEVAAYSQDWFPRRGVVEPTEEELSRHAAFLGSKDWIWKRVLESNPV